MKKVVTLFGVLVALVLIALFFQNRRSNAIGGSRKGAAMRTLLLPALPVDDVQKIVIRDKDQSVEIAVKDGKWRIPQRSDYPAAVDKIHRVLISFLELKVAEKNVVGKSALAELNLDAPKDGATDHTGLYVEFLNGKGGTVASFVAGKNVESSGGANSNSFMGGPGEQRFVRVLQDDANDVYTIWTISDSLSDFQPKAEDWIDKAFVDVRKLRSAEVTTLNPADSWTAARADENTEFKMLGSKAGEDLDTAKASGLNYLLSGASFTDVLTKDKVNPDLFKSAVKAKLETFENFHYQVEAAPKQEGSKPESESVYYFKVKVSADIQAERKAEANEKPEDKKKRDEEFAAQKKQLEDKLAKEKALEGWVYEVSSTTLGVILKKKGELLRDKSTEKPAVGKNGIPSLNLHSPVTTPPVSLPPAPAPTPEAKPEPAKTEVKPEAPAPPAPTAPAQPAKPADKPVPMPAQPEKPAPAPAPAPANAAPAPTPKPAPVAQPTAPAPTPAPESKPQPPADKAPENKPAPAAAAPAPDAKPAGS